MTVVDLGTGTPTATGTSGFPANCTGGVLPGPASGFYIFTFDPVSAPVDSALDDAHADGDTDLILHCHTQEVTIQPGQAIACLEGLTDSGDPFPFTGFGDDVKASLGINTLSACAVESSRDPRPSDINRDLRVDILEAVSLKSHMNSDLGQPACDLGWDLNADVVVNVVDALALKPRQGAECEWAAGGTP